MVKWLLMVDRNAIKSTARFLIICFCAFVTHSRWPPQVGDFLFHLRTGQSSGHIRRYLVSGRRSKRPLFCPSPQEICTVCGHKVEDGGRFECSCIKHGQCICPIGMPSA
jgi:hypothetical protein